MTLLPSDDTGFRIRFDPTQDPKREQNQMHVDLTSTSLEDQQQTVALESAPGRRHAEMHVVLADPEGNEFCVIEPGNNFLADCGFVGAVACYGSQAGRVLLEQGAGRGRWSSDQNQETAIRSPHGGPKITWGGPPLKPKTGKYRLHFRPRSTRRRRSASGGRPSHRTRGNAHRHRSRRGELGGHGRSRWPRILCLDPALARVYVTLAARRANAVPGGPSSNRRRIASAQASGVDADVSTSRS